MIIQTSKYILLLSLLFQSCSVLSNTPSNPHVRFYQGDYFVSYQTDKYRIWMFNSGWRYDECKTHTLVKSFCEQGIINGQLFYERFRRTGINDFDSSVFYTTEFKPQMEDDIDSFVGSKIFIEEVWIDWTKAGIDKDTITIGFCVNLNGNLSSNYDIYHLRFTIKKNSKYCDGVLVDPKFVDVKHKGIRI